MKSPVVFFAVFLLLLFIIAIAYSSSDISDSLSALKKYRELLFIPVVISILHGNQIAKKRCEYSFILGCIILMTISYCMYFSILPAARYGNSIVYHITHSFFMSVLAFHAAHRIFDSKKLYKLLWIFIFLATVFNQFYIATGRTGMLVFLVLMILFVIQRLSNFQKIVGVVLLSILLTITYLTSSNFSSRSHLAVKEIQNYQYGASRSSLGMRFDWWTNCIMLIKERPIIGHGTGAFTLAHDKHIEGTKIRPTDNPHNEYLLIAVQLGIVGLLVYLLLLISIAKCSFQLERSSRFYAQGVVIAMATGCIMNSFLFDSHQGHFFAILSAVYFSSKPDCVFFSKRFFPSKNIQKSSTNLMKL